MNSHVYLAQKPLRDSYDATPALATVTDHARTCGAALGDPFRTKVEPMDGCGVVVPIGTHAALGGPHDAPTPGDMLCAALAACQDSAFRTVANLLGIELTQLEVRVTATAAVPVGFQAMTCDVVFAVKAGTSPALLKKLQVAAEHCCVVQQTLKAPPNVQTSFVESGTCPTSAIFKDLDIRGLK